MQQHISGDVFGFIPSCSAVYERM